MPRTYATTPQRRAGATGVPTKPNLSNGGLYRGGGGFDVGGRYMPQFGGRPKGASSNDYGTAGMSTGTSWGNGGAFGIKKNMLGNISGNFDKQTHTSRDFYNDYKDIADEQYEKTQGILDKQKPIDQDYLNHVDDNIRDYRGRANAAYDYYTQRSEATAQEAEDQSADARQTYTGTLRPAMKNNMEDLGKEAWGTMGANGQRTGGAMSLKEAGDPNNSTQKGYRDLYENQAQGYRNQGLADAGVLNAMGAQSFQNSMGNGPMTGAQMQLGQSAALQQGSQAYAGAQRQMDRLREMGMDVGREESGKQYARGESAKDRYSASQRDFSGAEDAYTSRAQGLRGERMGNYGNQYDATRGRAQEDFDQNVAWGQARHGLASDQNANDLAAVGDLYGTRLGGKGMQYQGNVQMQGGMLGAAGKSLPFLMG